MPASIDKTNLEIKLWRFQQKLQATRGVADDLARDLAMTIASFAPYERGKLKDALREVRIVENNRSRYRVEIGSRDLGEPRPGSGTGLGLIREFLDQNRRRPAGSRRRARASEDPGMRLGWGVLARFGGLLARAVNWAYSLRRGRPKLADESLWHFEPYMAWRALSKKQKQQYAEFRSWRMPEPRYWMLQNWGSADRRIASKNVGIPGTAYIERGIGVWRPRAEAAVRNLLR